MANAQRLVRQWLETDAAFGAAEVPLPAPAGRAPRAAAPVARPSVAAAVEALRSPPHPPAAALAARPALPAALIPGAVEPAQAQPRRAVALPATPPGEIAALPALTRAAKEAALAELRRHAEEQSRPHINTSATKLVFGEGDADAELMFIGEGPGAEEDRTGRPFVGRSGQLLDKMIAAMGFQRGQVYIGNVVKLRCADWDEASGRLKDRPPTPEEAGRGLPLLHRQIEIIRPKVIVTLGAPAVRYLTGTTQGVMSIRGTWLNYRGIPVMPTYHPSFLLRSYTAENRKKVWDDLQQAMKKIGRAIGKAPG